MSAKTNTTVRSALGALTVGPAQVVLFDTPGVVASANYKTPVHERRVQSAWRVARDADLLLFLVDAQRQLQRPDPRVLAVVEDYGRRVAAAEARAAQTADTAAEADVARARQQEQEQDQQQHNVDGLDSMSEQQQQRRRRHEAVRAKALAAATDESWPPAVLLLNKVGWRGGGSNHLLVLIVLNAALT